MNTYRDRPASTITGQLTREEVGMYTKGPWGVERDGFSIFMGDQVVATAIAPDGAPLSEQKANARLIAAAPKLLVELRAVTHLAETLNARQHAGLGITSRMWAELYNETMRARAAIAEAEGGCA